MTDPDKTPDNQSREPQFTDLLCDIWKARISVLTGAVLGGLVTLILWAALVPHYSAKLYLLPADPMKNINLSSLLQKDGFSVLSDFVEQSGVLSSPGLAQFKTVYFTAPVTGQLLNDNRIRQGLLADSWLRWVKPQSQWSRPQFSQYVKDRVVLTRGNQHGITLMEYRHPDPEFAAYFLKTLHDLSDDVIRSETLVRTNERIAYLRDNIAAMQNPENRRALTALLYEQERMKMLVSIDQDFAARIVGDAVQSPEPVWPDWPLLASVLIFIGAAFGYFADRFRQMRKSR